VYDGVYGAQKLRRGLQGFGKPGTYPGRHSALKLAFVPRRPADPLSMTLRYFEGCKQGYLLDLVRPVDTTTPPPMPIG
jgi:hypothetical protein